MAEYRHSAHATFDLKYHMVWCTKYRYKIMAGRIAERGRDLIRQVCESRDVVIIRGAVDEATIKAYIENQKWDEDEEGFKITAPAKP